MFAFLAKHGEILFYLTLAAGLPAWWNSSCTPRFSDDSYQYLSTARNLTEGHGAVTSIAHYDAERMQKHLPAAITSYPPGYSVLVAAGAATGLSLEQSAQAVGTIAFACVLLISAALGRILGVPWEGRLLLTLVLAVHGMSARLATIILK